MYFEELYSRLLEMARHRIRTGQVSERSLARLSGTSQPHLHNALKNIRTLSPAAADRLMRALGIAVPDLLWRRSGEIEAAVGAVPVLRDRIGPGSSADLRACRGYYPLPNSLVTGLISPVLARLTPDLVLPRPLEYTDLILVDQNPAVREAPAGDDCWVIAEAAGLRARYVMRQGAGLFVANEATKNNPGAWQAIAATSGNILNIVRARIVWISREMEKKPAGPPEPPGEGN